MRQEKQQTLHEVAQLAGLPDSVLSDIEQHSQIVSDGAVLYDIAQALNVPIARILGISQCNCQSREEARRCIRPYLWQLARDRGQRMKMRREYLGYSISDVGRALDYSYTVISEQERGTTLKAKPHLIKSISKLYGCPFEWILGDAPDDLFGPRIANVKLRIPAQLFLLHPAHVQELCQEAGITERKLSKKICVPVSDLRAYSKLSRIEVSEEMFRTLCLILAVGPAELRAEPVKSSVGSDPIQTSLIDSSAICAQIIDAAASGHLSKEAFCKRFNLNEHHWEQIQTKQLKFSSAIIATIQPMLSRAVV